MFFCQDDIGTTMGRPAKHRRAGRYSTYCWGFGIGLSMSQLFWKTPQRVEAQNQMLICITVFAGQSNRMECDHLGLPGFAKPEM